MTTRLPLRVVLLEDNRHDADLIQASLEADGFTCDITRVQTQAEFTTELSRGDLDVILADYRLPSFDGLAAFKIAFAAHPDVPFIFVSGTLGEEAAIEALKAGATDYVLKSGLSKLGPSVRRALAEAEERAERRKAEAALRRSEMYLAEAQRVSHTGSIGWDSLSGEIYWSDETYRIFECEPTTKPTIQLVIERIHPDDRMHLRQIVDNASIERRAFTVEHRLIMVDGSVKYVRVVAHPSASEDPGSTIFVGAVTDITERKRVEERLRVQHTVALILAEAATIEEATLRILRAMGECLGWDVGALWRVDQKAEALRCVELWHKASIEVPEFERVSREFTFVPGLGLPGRVWSSLEPEYIPDVIPDENFPRAPIAEREGLHAALGFPILLGGEILGVIEFYSREIRRPDQELLNVLATIGSQIGQFIERKHGEEALRESEAKIRRLVDANIIGIFMWDFDGRILEANEAFLHIVGYDHEDLVAGRIRWTDLTPVEWRDHDTRLIQEHKATGVLPPFEKEYFRKDGSRVPVLIGVATFEEGGNQGVAFVVDLTERKCAEERLRHLESDLAHMNRVSMMGELATALSHEITQPIASAHNNARAAQNFLGMQPPDFGEVREALSCIVGDTDRAGEMIDRMRDHLKKAPPRKEQFDLNEAINEVIALGRSAIIENGVSVQTRLCEKLFPIPGDRVQLQQVILNLLLNAVEAMGSVKAKPRDLLISTEQDNSGVVVEVRDSGPGIDPSNLERVFDAFYTTKSSGMGMGLSICRSIIEAHGGRLWAEANEPRGAIFQFTLPAVS